MSAFASTGGGTDLFLANGAAFRAEEAVPVSVESFHTKDGLTYVFLKNGDRTYRQEVKRRRNNDTEVIVHIGLTEEDLLYLSQPADTAGVALRRRAQQEARASKGAVE